MKEYNEYNDKLVSVETALAAAAAGFDDHQVECFTKFEGEPDGQFMDSYSGLIGDGEEFICYRPTQSALQKWLRDKHGITVESNFLPNIKKYRCFYKPQNIIPKDFKDWKEYYIAVDKYFGKENYDTYEEALEVGLFRAAEQIKLNKS